MSDRRKSIRDYPKPQLQPPPPAPPQSPSTLPARPDPLESWQELQPFRQTFLRHFSAPGHREALETVGEMVFTMALEYAGYWPQSEEPALLEELRTAAEDVRFLHGFLFYAVQESGPDSMVDRHREVYLLAKAGEWADRLDEIASEMQEAVSE